MTSKSVEVRVAITELHYIGWAEIKTNGHRQQTRTGVITQLNSRRGSALPEEIKTDSIWISENEKECANIVVNTMMQGDLLDGIVNKTVRR